MTAVRNSCKGPPFWVLRAVKSKLNISGRQLSVYLLPYTKAWLAVVAAAVVGSAVVEIKLKLKSLSCCFAVVVGKMFEPQQQGFRAQQPHLFGLTRHLSAHPQHLLCV